MIGGSTQVKKPPRAKFGSEAATKPSASSPFAIGRTSGSVPRSRRDPSELVSERPSHARPAVRTGGGDASRSRQGSRAHPTSDVAPATPRAADGAVALEAVPRVVAPTQRLKGLPLDHQAGFVLACIDGESTVQTLIDVCGLPPVEVVRTLERLVELGVVVLR
jgi:hypothetical protein